MTYDTNRDIEAEGQRAIPRSTINAPTPLYYVTRFTLDGRHALCEVATGRVLIRDLDALLSSRATKD